MESSTHSRSHSTSYIRDEAPHPLAKACDQCHRCKVACDGGRPTCDRCGKNGSACTYSTGKPIGKPKGSKNRSKLETQRTATNKIDPASSVQLVASDSSGKRKTNAGASPGAHQVVVGTPSSFRKYKEMLTVCRITNDNDRVFACHLQQVQTRECWDTSESRSFPLGPPFHRSMRSNLHFNQGTPPVHIRCRLQNSSSYSYRRYTLPDMSSMLPLTTTSISRMIGCLAWSTTAMPNWMLSSQHWSSHRLPHHLYLRLVRVDQTR